MKKAVLFVDDELNVIQGLKRMLRIKRDEWEMFFAGGGEEALEILNKNKVDVIVSDMRMPNMDGSELLNRVAEYYPHVVRIILSGHSDQEMILRATKSTHQFLTKPCTTEILIDTVERACSLRDLLKNENLVKLTTGIKNLPSLPDLYYKLVREIQSPDSSIKKIGDIISRDVAMTAKVLQFVNSAFFGLPQRIINPHQAVSLLGVNIIKALVLSIHVFSTFKTLPNSEISIEELWEHSMQVASLAQKIAQSEITNKKILDDLFIAGILHDLGKLLLLQVPEYYKKVHDLLLEKSITIYEAEYEAWETSHAEIGAYLLGLWGLPNAIVESVAYHHYPSKLSIVNFSMVTALHIANAICMEKSIPQNISDCQYLDFDHVKKVRIEDKFPEWNKLYQKIKEKRITYES